MQIKPINTNSLSELQKNVSRITTIKPERKKADGCFSEKHLSFLYKNEIKNNDPLVANNEKLVEIPITNKNVAIPHLKKRGRKKKCNKNGLERMLD